MFTQERHSVIKRLVRERGRMSFAELQKKVKVSPATLRRDLTELEEAGELIRVHGGVLDPAYVRTEVSFDERVLKNNAAKRAIAQRAAALIEPGSSVFIDAGSTCLEAGKLLLRRKDIRVITHSVALIGWGPQAEGGMIVIGGELRKVSGALVGGRALSALEHIRADFAFIGASGLNADGCSTTELSEAEMKRAIMECSTRKLLLADSSKWQAPSMIRFAVWDDIDDWVTDKAPEEASLLPHLVTIHAP